MKRGMYFSTDAFLAAVVIVLGIVVASTFFINSTPRSPIDYLSSDIVNTLSYVQIGAINNPYLEVLRGQGFISPEKEQYTILEFVARLYIDGHPNEVTALIRNLTGPLIPYALNLQIVLDGETIYSNAPQAPKEIAVGRRMVSGIGIAKPLNGYTARATVAGIGVKDNVNYEYFGGRSGFGNVSKRFFSLPDDAAIYNITIKANPYSSSQWFLNGVNCLNISSGLPYVAQSVTASGCLPFVLKKNEMSVLFSTPTYADQYLQGAVVEINYSTQQFVDPESGSSSVFRLDGIRGLIDLASGFYAKGVITGVSAFLHFENEGAGTDVDRDGVVEEQPTLYVRVGNSTVFQTNKSAYNGTWLYWSDLSSLVDWNAQTTFPLFIGYNNTLPGKVRGGGADVVFVTEVSSSMGALFVNGTAGIKSVCTYEPPANSSARRLGFAKCGVRSSASEVFVNPLSRVGLVAFDRVEYNVSRVNLTRNELLVYGTIGLDSPLSGYDVSGQSRSCVCCGINTARDELRKSLLRKTFVYNHSTWKYATSAPEGWTALGFDDSAWSTGSAVFGANSISSEKIITPWPSTVNNYATNVFFGEVALDASSPVADFTNGVYFVQNTFGPQNVSDGWDSACGGAWAANNCSSDRSGVWINLDPNYDRDQSDNVVQNQSELRIVFKDLNGDGVVDNDVLGAVFGTTLAINSSVFNMVKGGGAASLKVRLRVAHTLGNWTINGVIDKPQEALWIKARMGKSDATMQYLGSDIDRGNTSADVSSEIFWCQGLETQYRVVYGGGLSDKMPFENSCLPLLQERFVEINITGALNSSGVGDVYVELGAKLDTKKSQTNDRFTSEWIVGFDDLLISVFNKTDSYFLRKQFTNNNVPFEPEFGIANVLVDDSASVWLNGHLLDVDVEPHVGNYWNRRGIFIPGYWINNGSNVVAVRVDNSKSQSKFDFELHGFNRSVSRNIVLSLDDVPDATCLDQNSGVAVVDALNASCQALERWGIRTYVMGASSVADPDFLRNVTCGGGLSFVPGVGDNPINYFGSLAQTIDFSSVIDYQNIGALIWGKSILYPDSYVEVNVSPFSGPMQFGELTLNRNLATFSGCNGAYTLPPKLRFVDGFIYALPGPSVNALLNTNNLIVYNWSAWGKNFAMQGNPVRMYAKGIGAGYNGFVYGADNGVVPEVLQVIVDNNDWGFLGEPDFSIVRDDPAEWDESYLGEYAVSNNPQSKDICTWTPELSVDGDYKVYLWSPRGHNEASLEIQQVTVNYAGGSELFEIDYSETSPTAGTWNYLGTFPFIAGQGNVEQVNENVKEAMACDAVMFEFDPGAAQCSNIAGFFGKVALKADSGFSPVLPQIDGCNWQISFSSGSTLVIPVPSNYTGIKNCRYGPAGPLYSLNNSVQYATFKLLENLDWDDNLLVDLNINDIYAEFDSISIDEAPYLWGPAILEVKAWY